MRAAPLFLAMLTAPTLAQGLQWQLPEHGGVLYTRALTVDSQTEPAATTVPATWYGREPAAIVLDGELDADRVRRAAPLQDVREIVAQLGLDLDRQRAGKGRLDIATENVFQPIRVEVTFGALGDDGQQTFAATIGPDAKAMRKGDARQQRLPRLTGQVKGSRTVDRARGLVTRIEGRAELVIEFPPEQRGDTFLPLRRRKVQLADEWRDPVVIAPDSPECKRRIAEAIRASMESLRSGIEARSRQPAAPGGNPYHDVQAGELALILLALRHGGEAANDRLLTLGYESLRARVIEGTYSLSVALLALEALYAPAGESEMMRAGTITAPLPRKLSTVDLELAQGWVEALLDNIDTTVDQAYLRRWHYGPSQSYDNSNTQYALLGLYAAQLCGVEISPQVWTAAANHWLDCAVVEGDPDAVEMVRHRDLAKKSRTRARSTRVKPHGWGYGRGNPTGSMTTAGISGLTLCTAGLRLQKKGSPKLLRQMQNAVRGGFLWLQHEFSVRGNPGSWGNWHLYYLYGLERACELNQIARLGDRDWYFEGALQLIATQDAGGSWGSVSDTAFGLLFLKKTALPAITEK